MEIYTHATKYTYSCNVNVYLFSSNIGGPSKDEKSKIICKVKVLFYSSDIGGPPKDEKVEKIWKKTKTDENRQNCLKATGIWNSVADLCPKAGLASYLTGLGISTCYCRGWSRR